jgi:hypothetical protein
VWCRPNGLGAARSRSSSSFTPSYVGSRIDSIQTYAYLSSVLGQRTGQFIVQSQDIVILLKLLSLESQARQPCLDGSASSDPLALRSLEGALGISKTEISASLRRSVVATLAIKSNDRPKVNRRNLTEFVKHGLKYAFPIKAGAPQRGVATSFAAPMLEGQLVSSGADIHVWPYANGNQRGLSITPLFKSVPEAVLKDARLYELLALVDAIRLGNQREANLAQDIFEKRMARV